MLKALLYHFKQIFLLNYISLKIMLLEPRYIPLLILLPWKSKWHTGYYSFFLFLSLFSKYNPYFIVRNKQLGPLFFESAPGCGGKIVTSYVYYRFFSYFIGVMRN